MPSLGSNNLVITAVGNDEEFESEHRSVEPK